MYALFTDTDCDITPEIAAQYGYKLISMPYTIEGKQIFPYVDFKEFDLKDLQELMTQKGMGEGKLRGAHIPVETVVSGNDHVILIGDAGGFANKLTYEGLYYAIVTAHNAWQAIVGDKPFTETNQEIFQKKQRESRLTRLFYSPFGLWLVRLGAHSPTLIKRVFPPAGYGDGTV